MGSDPQSYLAYINEVLHRPCKEREKALVAERDALRLSLAQREAQVAVMTELIEISKPLAHLQQNGDEARVDDVHGHFVRSLRDQKALFWRMCHTATPDLQALAETARRNAEAFAVAENAMRLLRDLGFHRQNPDHPIWARWAAIDAAKGRETR